MPLDHQGRIDDPDGFYEDLIACQRGLSEDDALRLQARLVLVLAHQVGDREVLREALEVAGRGLARA